MSVYEVQSINNRVYGQTPLSTIIAHVGTQQPKKRNILNESCKQMMPLRFVDSH